MASMTLLCVQFYIHAILMQPAISLVWAEEDEEAPFQTLCSTNCQDADNTNDMQDFPLNKCSCSPSCSTYRDCCYDSPYRREKSTWNRIKSSCLLIFGRGQYRVISGCPAGELSDSCHDSMGHLPPVTSKTTNTSYANIFCAACNGDWDNVITWNVELRCSSDKKGDIEAKVDDSTVLVYRSNHIWRLSKSTRSICTYYVHDDNFSVIDGLELRFCFFESRNLACSRTWKDKEILKLCRSYEDPVYFNDKFFRNLHCAMCNYMNPTFAKCIPSNIEAMLQKGEVDPDLTLFCRNRGSKACMDYLSMAGKGSTYPFSRLLIINEMACVPEPGARCCRGERYDFRSKRCRKISQKF